LLLVLGLPLVPVACLCDQASAAARVRAAEPREHCHGAPVDRAPPRTSDHAGGCAHCHPTIGPGTATQLAAAPPACWSTVLQSVSVRMFAAGAASHAWLCRRTESPPEHTPLRSECVLQI